jgi:hypothetical protein
LKERNYHGIPFRYHGTRRKFRPFEAWLSYSHCLMGNPILIGQGLSSDSSTFTASAVQRPAHPRQQTHRRLLLALDLSDTGLTYA